jgi:replicative DNA helicase
MINGNENQRQFLGGLIYASEAGNFPGDIKLTSADFTTSSYQKIFDEILRQHNAGGIVTIITLNQALPDVPASDISELTTETTEHNIPLFENIIFEESKKAAFVKALKIALEEINNKTDVDTIIKNLIPALADVTNAKNEAAILTAAELLEKIFPPLKWIIPGLIGDGLIMIAGAPKIGKSWFVLQLAIAASYGGRFLDVMANKTETLYISLEDTERRLQSRMKLLKAPAVNELKIVTQWNDRYIGIENYLEKNKNTGLVIIDTLGRFAGIEDMNDYSTTTAALAGLKKIADRKQITMIVVHHARKGENRNGTKNDPVEAALGSTGLTGTVDSIVTLFRDRTKDRVNRKGELYVTGRDAPDVTKKIILDIENGGWSVNPESDNPDPPDSKKQPDNGALGERPKNMSEVWKGMLKEGNNE